MDEPTTRPRTAEHAPNVSSGNRSHDPSELKCQVPRLSPRGQSGQEISEASEVRLGLSVPGNIPVVFQSAASCKDGFN